MVFSKGDWEGAFIFGELDKGGDEGCKRLMVLEWPRRSSEDRDYIYFPAPFAASHFFPFTLNVGRSWI